MSHTSLNPNENMSYPVRKSLPYGSQQPPYCHDCRVLVKKSTQWRCINSNQSHAMYSVSSRHCVTGLPRTLNFFKLGNHIYFLPRTSLWHCCSSTTDLNSYIGSMFRIPVYLFTYNSDIYNNFNKAQHLKYMPISCMIVFTTDD